MGDPAIEQNSQAELLQTDLESSFSSLAYMSGSFDGVFALFGDSGADTLDLSAGLNSTSLDLSHVLGLSEASNGQESHFSTNNHKLNASYNTNSLEMCKAIYTPPDPGGTHSELPFATPHPGRSPILPALNIGAHTTSSNQKALLLGHVGQHQHSDIEQSGAPDKFNAQNSHSPSDSINSYDIDATQILNDIAWQMTHTRPDFNSFNLTNARLPTASDDSNSNRLLIPSAMEDLPPIIQDPLRSRHNFRSSSSLTSSLQDNQEDNDDRTRNDLAATLSALKDPLMDGNIRSDEVSLGSSSSTATSRESKRPRQRNDAMNSYQDSRSSSSSNKYNREETVTLRPALNDDVLAELNNLSSFQDEKSRQLMTEYSEHISFPLGEGGRELLRACLNHKGCKGRKLQGASVPTLLALAKSWDLWNVALRIKVERSTGIYCPEHEAFVKFKSTQSQQRKYIKKEYMVTERDKSGKISRIVYDENRKITLGKEGREALRSQLRRLHDKHAHEMDKLLERRGLKYSELRNATVQQLAHMAYICNLWPQVEHACRKQEEKRDWKCREVFGGRRDSIDESQSDFISLNKRSRLSESPRDSTLYGQGFDSSEDLPNNRFKTEPRHSSNIPEVKIKRALDDESRSPELRPRDGMSQSDRREATFLHEQCEITPASVDQLFGDSAFVESQDMTCTAESKSSFESPFAQSNRSDTTVSTNVPGDSEGTTPSSPDIDQTAESRLSLDQYSLDLFRQNFGEFEAELPHLFTPTTDANAFRPSQHC